LLLDRVTGQPFGRPGGSQRPATAYAYDFDFPEQWNPKSPWHDRRVRLATNFAIDKQGVNEAERMGLSRLTGSIIPSVMEFALRLDQYPYDVARARRLLAEAGYPNGFDAGDLTPVPPFTSFGETISNSLAAVGIKTRVRSMSARPSSRAGGPRSCAASSWAPPRDWAMRPRGSRRS
jgi:peptide/nickel transport system substrate-binding protein